MKKLIIATSMISSAFAVNPPGQCLADYDLIKNDSFKREIIAELQVESDNASFTLGSLQLAAFKHYRNLIEIGGESVVKVQTAVYKDKSGTGKINGYRIRLDSEYHDEDIVSYYFSASKRLMKTYHDGQTPYSEWECVGYKTDQDLIDEYIEDIADETQYSYGDFSGIKNVATIKFDKLPAIIQKKAESYIEHDADPDYPRSNFIDKEALYTISKEGKVVGYIIHMHDDIDHPLWDGSGVFYFLNSLGQEVGNFSWEG